MFQTEGLKLGKRRKGKNATSNKFNNKTILWMIGFVAVVFTACLMFFLNQREKETAQTEENNTVNPQPSADIEVVEQRVESVAFASLPSRTHPEHEAVKETEEGPEAKRLANWKDNFPYQPTTDPDVVITKEMLANYGSGDPTVIHNHCYLRSFFESEARFTSQFEQLYRILEEHGRGDNPKQIAKIYSALWHYHEYLQKPPEEDSSAYSLREERYNTNAEMAEVWFESIVYSLHAERVWPDKEFMPEDEAVALRDRIVNEIQGMDKLPEPEFAIDHDYRDELEEGFSPLVISPGWQKAYDEWNQKWDIREEIERMKRLNRELSVAEGNVLLADGKPIEYREGEHVASITTPDGYQVPLHLDDNGKVIIPTPAEIEEMKANGEGEWVGLPERTAPPPPQLTEEEWKMQEALRQLEDAARQQE